jgi:hypothetical protein
VPDSKSKKSHGSDGSAGFIGVAVAMLLMGGGLVYWKLSSDQAAQPAETATDASKTSAPPKATLEMAPPPPPPPEEEDAGAADAEVAPSGQKAKKAGKGPCQPPCKGKVTGTLQAALRGRAGQARRCYERALRLNPSLQGRMTINVTVGSNGQVCSASIGSNSLGDHSVATCVVGSFQGAQLPPPQGGCVNAAVPVNFVPKAR